MKLFILFFILSLPALGALGFDLWLAYGETMDFSKPLQLSAVGWLWVKYAEANYNMMRDTIDPATWASFIKPILSQKLVTIALLPVYIGAPIVLTMKLFGLGRYEGEGLLNGFGQRKKAGRQGFTSNVNLSNKTKKKIKYSRR